MKQNWTLELVSPRKAKEYLNKNMVNRPISRSTVEAYASDMINGRWDVHTTSAIALNSAGELKDGQHRLTAVILADIPVYLWVCRGVGDHVVFDSGRNRKMSDYMKIEHPELPSYYHSNKILSAIKFLVINTRPNSNISQRSRVSQHELEEFVFEHREDLDEFFTAIPSTAVAKITVACIYLCLFMAYKGGVSLDELSRFFSVLCSGMSEGSADYPIIAYRNYLLGKDTTVLITHEEIRKCQGAIKKYLTRSGLKRVYEPKELIWEFPYKQEE